MEQKTPGPCDLSSESYEIHKGEISPNPYKFFHRGDLTVLKSLWGQPSTIPKLDEDTARKENYRPIFLRNTDVKILNKILANQIQ